MKRKVTLIAVIVFIVVGIIAIAIFYPSPKENETKGSISADCPVHVYQVGEIFEIGCSVPPSGSCSFSDSKGCIYNVNNVGDSDISEGDNVIVLAEIIGGEIQYLDVGIPE